MMSKYCKLSAFALGTASIACLKVGVPGLAEVGGVLPGWFSVWLPPPAHGTAAFPSQLVAKKLLWIRVVGSSLSLQSWAL